MATKHTTRTDAINAEIVRPIEATEGGHAVKDAWAEYDIDAIADQVLLTVGDGTTYGYILNEDVDFWEVVLSNQL